MSDGKLIAARRIYARTVQHTLAIASCRIAVTQACLASGYRLMTWLGESELSLLMTDTGILPDAFFLIERLTSTGAKTAGFFLEVDRSGRSDHGMEEKFAGYGRLYYDGLYQSRFGTRALRVLALIGADYGIKPDRQITKLATLARRTGVTIMRFAPLPDFLSQPTGHLWTAPIWRHPANEELCALF
jgi:hypothetical protein